MHERINFPSLKSVQKQTELDTALNTVDINDDRIISEGFEGCKRTLHLRKVLEFLFVNIKIGSTIKTHMSNSW